MGFNFTVLLEATPTAAFSKAITLFVVAFAASGLLFGFTRGFTKSILRLVTVILSIIASVLVMGMLFDLCTNLIAGKTIEELIITYYPSGYDSIPENWRNLLACFDADIVFRLSLLAIGIIIVPLIFMIAFYLFKAVSMVIYWIVSAIAGASFRRKSFISRLLGAAVGALQGALIAAVILVPVAGYAGIASDVRVILTSDEVTDETAGKVDEFYIWWLDGIIENPIITTIGTLGGDQLFDSMTVIDYDEDEIDLKHEALVISQIVADALPLSGADPLAPDESAKEAMSNIVSDVGENKFTASIISGILRGVGTAVDREALLVPADEPYKSLITDSLLIFKDSTSENVYQDMSTILEVYFILSDTGSLVAFGEPENSESANCLITPHEGGTAIDQIIAVLNENERTRPIVSTLTKISVGIMCESFGLDQDATELYSNVKDGINDVVSVNKGDYETEEEYKDAVSDKLDEKLRENNIQLEEQIVDDMSQYIVDNYSDVDEVTDEVVNDVILSYYDAYKDSVSGAE